MSIKKKDADLNNPLLDDLQNNKKSGIIYKAYGNNVTNQDFFTRVANEHLVKGYSIIKTVPWGDTLIMEIVEISRTYATPPDIDNLN